MGILAATGPLPCAAAHAGNESSSINENHKKDLFPSNMSNPLGGKNQPDTVILPLKLIDRTISKKPVKANVAGFCPAIKASNRFAAIHTSNRSVRPVADVLL